MFIAIRKENNSVYIDKEIYSNDIFAEIDLTQEPYNYTKVQVDDAYADCIASDFDADTLELDVTKYNARKQIIAEYEYKTAISNKIRERYTLDDELAILRQRDAKPQEFAEYNEFVEQCKTEVRDAIN